MGTLTATLVPDALTRRERSLRDVEEARSVLNRLLWVAKHSSMQEQLELALRELDDAREWLLNPQGRRTESVLELAELAIKAARSRIDIVDRAVTTRDIDRLFGD